LPTSNDTDPWGRLTVDPERVFSLLYLGAKPSEIVCDTTDEIEHYNRLCAIWNKPDDLINSAPPDIDPEKDRLNRIADWKIPNNYTDTDVRAYLLSKCKTDVERERVAMEMDLFEEKSLTNLLRLMIALVDHFRDRGIVWGIGRGSSVSSYCLYLIGIHRIDSIRYDLDIKEFLR
jgi:DNA polymerase III alpha subunit